MRSQLITIIPDRFIKPLLLEACIAMGIWILFSFVSRMAKQNKGLSVLVGVEIKYFLFYIYAVAVLSLTIIPLPFKRFRQPNEYGINIIPLVNTFKGLVQIDNSNSLRKLSKDYNFQNIAGNVLMFTPLGMFLPALFKKFRSFKKVVALGCICSVSIELSQLISRHFEIYRTVDIDDVILNTSGAALGFWLYMLIEKSFRKLQDR